MKWLKTFDEDFVRENFKDKALAESIIKDQRKRYKVLLVIVISFALVALVAIADAVIKLSHRKDIETEAGSFVKQIDACVLQARTEMEKALAAPRATAERYQAIQIQLKNCSESKSKR